MIGSDCLFCHANRVHPVAGTDNCYETPIFEGGGIGCERCHGPGELHARRKAPSKETDLTIVNPADLAPALRDSVCQQCHLQGALRFTRAGRATFDFRPGLPFHRFWAVFMKTTEGEKKFAAVGHVEQMESSRCFRESRGALGCISCHDPHRLPPASVKIAYYRERCLACHAQRKGCDLPEAERQGRGNDCVACHMPRPAVSNIPHTAATDHRILRGPDKAPPDAPGPEEEAPVVDYQAGQMTDDERQAAARDLGVALSSAGWYVRASPRQASALGTQAVPLLEAAIRDRPDDLAAREALGVAEGLNRHNEEALRAFEGVLRIEPDRESALRSSALLLANLQRSDLSRQAWRKLFAVDPWRSDDRAALAQVCYRANDWPGAIAACREALRLNPARIEMHSLLVQCYLRSHEPEKASAEFQRLLEFNPAGRAVWLSWYERQKAEAAPARSP